MSTSDPGPGAPLLSVQGASRSFRLPRRRLFERAPVREALVDASIHVDPGESVALIGESGSGKTTLVRIALGLGTADRGEVRFRGRPVDDSTGRRSHWLRRETGIVFQDPYTSLDPRMDVGAIVAEPLAALSVGGDRRAAVAQVLQRVGLGAEFTGRYPAELSGGQRQRVALARAIVHRPSLLVGDEPLSALDVTVRSQIIDLLAELRRREGMALLLVSHDIGLVRHLCDRVYVLRAGRIVEQGPVRQVLNAPEHPYTRQLLASVPALRPAPRADSLDA